MLEYQRCQKQMWFSTAVLTVAVTVFLHTAESAPRYDSVLKQGTGKLDSGNPDSAIVFFVQAYTMGLPKDSLFYFWAEALLHKGVLDSALAANYIAAASTSTALRAKADIQRYTIYRMLGWNRDADRLIDTIRASREYRKLSPIPDVDIGITGGYGAEHRSSDTARPWGTGSGSSFYHDDQGVFTRADIKSTWAFIKGNRSLTAGLAGAASYRQYTPTGLRNAADSTDITGSFFTTVSGKLLSSTGTLTLNRRIDDSLYVRGSVEGGILGRSKMLPMFWCGGVLSVTPSGAYSSANTWLFTSLQQPLGDKLHLQYQLFANTYLEQATTFGLGTTAKILYVDDARRPYPVFYTDHTYQQVTDTVAASESGNFFDMIALTDAITESDHDTTVFLVLYQPFSNFVINPRVALQVTGRHSVRVGFSWKWSYFREKFEWDQLVNYTEYLLYSRTGNNYYFIPEGLLIDGLQVTHGDNGGLAITPAAQAGSPVIHHAVRRIDHAISADISIALFNGRFGTATLRATGTKTWSTLLDRAPIEIPVWSLSTSLEWRFKYTGQRVEY